MSNDNEKIVQLILPGENIERTATINIWPTIGGMATPFGIRLSNEMGYEGLTSLQLVATGAMMGAFFALIDFVTDTTTAYMHWSLNPTVVSLTGTMIYLASFRLTPLAAIHASEHQVIHNVEKFLPLTCENIASQPREHDRCGTNLCAWIIIVQIIMNTVISTVEFYFPSLVNASWLVMVAAVAAVFGARKLNIKFGTVLQKYLTTKTARSKDISRAREKALRFNGKIAEYIDSHDKTPGIITNIWLSIRNSGLLEMVFGMLAIGYLLRMLW